MSTEASVTKTLDNWLRRYATQATAALSLVVGVSGVMMFFHLGKETVEALHEWLGMGFVAVAIAHAVRHRASLVNMLSQPRMRVLFAAAAVVTAAFVLAPSGKGPNPFRQATQAMVQAPLKDVAPVLGVSADDLTARLRAAGFAVSDTSVSIDAIARQHGAEAPRVLAAVLSK